MNLPPDTIERKYLSIGEISERLNVAKPTIRFWCAQLEIKPHRSKLKNNRLFTPQDLELLVKVKELHDTGYYTVAGIKWVLSSDIETLSKEILIDEDFSKMVDLV